MAKAEVWRFVSLTRGSWWLLKDGTSADCMEGIANVSMPMGRGTLWAFPCIGGVRLDEKSIIGFRTAADGRRKIAEEIARQIVAKGGTVTIRPASRKKGWRRG